LKTLNNDLERLGVLPNLRLIENGENFLLGATSPNPQNEAVVSQSAPEPSESSNLQQNYDQSGYNGWNASAAGGGGASGSIDQQAAAGTVPEGEHKQLIDQALRLAGEEVNPANEAAVNTIVQHESGWNPNAINLTDSNAQAGHPSQGLMQTIPSTFNANALPGYNTNINDPLSNLVAGIRYSKANYGSLQNVPGVLATNNGKGYVGY
jgi:hypothetical protein